MCSSKVSDPANRLLKRTDSEGSSSVAEEKFSAVPFFSKRSHVGNLRQTLQGKGEIHKRVETAGVYPLVRPRGVSALPAEVQRKTPRPERANTPAAVRVPRWVGAEKEPPVRGEHANAVRAPRSAGAEKAAAPFERTACAVRVSRLTLRSYLTILREQSMLSQQQNRRKYEPVHPCTLRSVPRH